MSTRDTAATFFSLIEEGDFESAAGMMSKDFSVSGPFPKPLSGEAWLALQSKLKTAFPDWSFNLTGSHEHGNTVHSTVQVTGSHSGELDLSHMGMPAVAPTGISIQMPKEEMHVHVEGDKVTAVEVHPAPGGGLMGILAQLGVSPPEGPPAEA